MKALTIHQPFAQYLADDVKKYETRSWSTHYRGLVAIHAGKTWNNDLKMQAKSLSDRYRSLPDIGDTPVLGAILAIGLLEDCISSRVLRDRIDQTEAAVGNFANGRYGWKIKVIERFDNPIPAKGQQGLWEWDWSEADAQKRIAVVGSRKYPNLDYVVSYVQSLPSDTIIISGGAQGVDLCAEQTARERDMKVVRIPVDTYKLPQKYDERKIEYGRRARVRNQYIIEMAGSVTAFWDEKSTGTKDSIEKARAIGRPVSINPIVDPKQAPLVQQKLAGFLDTYNEIAYIEESKIQSDDSPDLDLYQWDKPWLINDQYVWAFRWLDGEREYYPVRIGSDKAKSIQRLISGMSLYYETMQLRVWLEKQAGWQDVPYEVVDVGDMTAAYFIRTGSEKECVPLKNVVFVQDQYNVAIAMEYYRNLKIVDIDGNIPYYAKFKGSEQVYVLDGTHRTLAHIWAGREFIHADVNHFPETFIEACGYIDVPDDSERTEIYLDVIKEAMSILNIGDKEYA